MSANDDDLDIGYRLVVKAVTVGDELPRSHVWDGDEHTDEELPGTCCWETIEAAREYARYSQGWVVKVGGVRVGSGDLADEVVIDEAEVLEIVEETTMKRTKTVTKAQGKRESATNPFSGLCAKCACRVGSKHAKGCPWGARIVEETR